MRKGIISEGETSSKTYEVLERIARVGGHDHLRPQVPQCV